MMWRTDEQVTAARKAPGWAEFHRQCGRHNVFFDHIERDGRRGPYKATAYTVEMRRGFAVSFHVADGTGKTPIEAVAAAYRAADRPVADDELDRLLGIGVPSAADFDDILGGETADDMEDILG
ncbi:MAG: hypothetical protein ABIQ19_09115 [Sphingomonas sp.]